ncbi:MAG TPA: hypothetical protein VLB84_11620 [Bacteroidia bacterium]|nr:hypothetical protein [Bacteroidia bacterium]
MKTYILKANKTKEWFDLKLTIADLIPIYHKREYTFEQLTGFINYMHYKPDWNTPMDDKEYKILYELHGNPETDFFKVKGCNLVVIPGTYIYPTKLTEQDIKDLDNYKQI